MTDRFKVFQARIDEVRPQAEVYVTAVACLSRGIREKARGLLGQIGVVVNSHRSGFHEVSRFSCLTPACMPKSAVTCLASDRQNLAKERSVSATAF